MNSTKWAYFILDRDDNKLSFFPTGLTVCNAKSIHYRSFTLTAEIIQRKMNITSNDMLDILLMVNNDLV